MHLQVQLTLLLIGHKSPISSCLVECMERAPRTLIYSHLEIAKKVFMGFRRNGTHVHLFRQNEIRQNGIIRNELTPMTHTGTCPISSSHECPITIAYYTDLNVCDMQCTSYYIGIYSIILKLVVGMEDQRVYTFQLKVYSCAQSATHPDGCQQYAN